MNAQFQNASRNQLNFFFRDLKGIKFNRYLKIQIFHKKLRIIHYILQIKKEKKNLICLVKFIFFKILKGLEFS